MRRLDLGLYSHPKEFFGGMRPIPEKEKDRTHDAASSRTASPTHYQLSYSGPLRICSFSLIDAIMPSDPGSKGDICQTTRVLIGKYFTFDTCS